MIALSRFILLMIPLHSVSLMSTIADSPLRGAHLRVLPRSFQPGLVETERDPHSRSIREIKGTLPELLNLMAERFNFSFTYVQDEVSDIGDSPVKLTRGWLGYLISGEVDLVLTGAVYYGPFPKLIDFTTPVTHNTLEVLIPFPVPANSNIRAIVRPFDYKSWSLVFGSVMMVWISLYGLSRIRKALLFQNSASFDSITSAPDYVISVLLSQGSWLPNNDRGSRVTRFIAGCWCLACFVLAAAYSSVLISYILAPNVKPLINSFNDLFRKPEVNLMVEKGTELEYFFLMRQEPEYFNPIRKRFREHPELLCNQTKLCLDEIGSGRNNRVYMNSGVTLNKIINEDLKESKGICRFTIAKEPLIYIYLHLVLRKQSPYTASFDRMILILAQNGMQLKWEAMYYPKKSHCLADHNSIPKNPRISLVNLSGAFYLLLVGLAISMLFFISEGVCYRLDKLVHGHC